MDCFDRGISMAQARSDDLLWKAAIAEDGMPVSAGARAMGGARADRCRSAGLNRQRSRGGASSSSHHGIVVGAGQA